AHGAHRDPLRPLPAPDPRHRRGGRQVRGRAGRGRGRRARQHHHRADRRPAAAPRPERGVPRHRARVGAAAPGQARPRHPHPARLSGGRRGVRGGGGRWSRDRYRPAPRERGAGRLHRRGGGRAAQRSRGARPDLPAGLQPPRCRAPRGGAGAARLNEREALDLIFLPGFSTADVATSVAGRGIGMDVVRTNVQRLGGEIDVETEVGGGTRFTLKLPPTVLLGHALAIRVGGVELAVPVTAVRGLYAVDPTDIHAGPEGETVELEGGALDLIRLDRVLGLTGEPPARRIPIMGLRAGRRVVAVAVDEFLGKQEIVIKSLGAFLEDAGPWAGASIAGDGRVVPLLDPTRLVNLGRD